MGKGHRGQSTAFAFTFLTAQLGAADLLMAFRTLASPSPAASEAENSPSPARPGTKRAADSGFSAAAPVLESVPVQTEHHRVPPHPALPP